MAIHVDTQCKKAIEKAAFRSMPELEELYGEKISIDKYFDNFTDTLHISISVFNETEESLSELSWFVAAKITNIHLMYGGRELIVYCSSKVRPVLESILSVDSRIREIYDDMAIIRYDSISKFIPPVSNDEGAQIRKVFFSENDFRIGIDIGGTHIKWLLCKGDKIIHSDLKKCSIANMASSGELIELLLTIIKSYEFYDFSTVGISWPAPILSNRIVTPIKIQKIIKNEGFEYISNLAALLEDRIGCTVLIFNDGYAGAIAVACQNSHSDILCLGLGYSLSAGYVPRDGVPPPAICELCGAILGLSEGHFVRVRDYVSLRFGIANIHKLLGLEYCGTTLEDAERFVQSSIGNPTKESDKIYCLYGIYLAEVIVLAYSIFGMHFVAVFGGLSKNSIIMESAQKWLKEKYKKYSIEYITSSIDTQYINAFGAAIASGRSSCSQEDKIK